MRTNMADALLESCEIDNGNRFGSMNRTLAADMVVPDDAPHVLFLDPGGVARNVDLPANPQIGDFYIIVNTADAAEVITVRTNAGGALTPPITPTQNETAWVFYSGATLGWRGFVAIGV